MSENYHYVSWAELKASNERMADVVSAAIRWREEIDKSLDVKDPGCDCPDCILYRAVEKYVAEETQK